jgi:hypothetical protein
MHRANGTDYCVAYRQWVKTHCYNISEPMALLNTKLIMGRELLRHAHRCS